MTAGRLRLIRKQQRREQRARARPLPPGLLNKGRARIPTTVPLREPPGLSFTFGDASGVLAARRLPRKDLAQVGIDALGNEGLALSKDALEEGAASLLGGSGGIYAFEQAGASLSAAAPIGVVLTDVGGIALGLFDAFGGDFSLQGYATTPQLDATSALGIAASQNQARLIRQSLRAGAPKFGFKGQADSSVFLM